MSWHGRWRERAAALRREVLALYFTVRDGRCPWYARLLAGPVIADDLSPIDLIPDFVPVLGLLGDLLLVPLGLLAVRRLIPPEVLEDARRPRGWLPRPSSSWGWRSRPCSGAWRGGRGRQRRPVWPGPSFAASSPPPGRGEDRPMHQPAARPNPGGAAFALVAAALFGASTPLAKLLLGEGVGPLLLAGLLYLGSGLGLMLWRLFRRSGEASLSRADLPWLAGAVASGGVAGPVLLMLGLAATPASTASLLLNLEGVFTALVAWFVFRENFDRRIALGMLAIVAGGAVLSWAGRPGAGVPWGPLAVAGACLCWAIDNNLTRQVSAADPVQVAGTKGLVAGAVNTAVAFATGATVPGVLAVLGAAGVEFVGYGVSLACFVLALRHLGTARAGAYFSTAPFVGAAVSLVVFREAVSWPLGVAGALMGLGVYLHLTERHDHEHDHEELVHEHAHVHDEHHQHAHGSDDPPGEPHTHPHPHPAVRHAHPHFPHLHHRHEH